MQLGIERLLEAGGYGAYSTHFDAIAEDGRFARLPLAAASSLMAKGYGYGAEGDALTAALMAAAVDLLGDTQFTEMYAMDFPRDAILMSHMGEGNWALARDDRPVRLIKRPLGIGGLDDPPTFLFQYATGPATLATLVSLGGGALPARRGRGRDPRHARSCPALEMPYGFFRPDSGVRGCMDAWLRLGGPHHQVLNPGRHADAWRVFCGWPAWSSRRCKGDDRGEGRAGEDRAGARGPAAARGRDRGRRRAALVDRGRRTSCSTPFAAGEPDDAFRGQGARAVAEPAARRALRLRAAPSTAPRSPSPSAATRPARPRAVARAGGRCGTSRDDGRARPPCCSPQPGYPFTLRARGRLPARRRRPRGDAAARPTPAPRRAPFGAGLHPYLSPGAAASTTSCSRCRRARASRSTSACCRPGRRCRSTGTDLDFRRAAAHRRPARWTPASATCDRDPAGVARVRLGAPAASGGSRSGWTRLPLRPCLHGRRLPDPERRRGGVAIEPMTCAPDAFNSGDGLVVLEPGASFAGRCGSHRGRLLP